MLPPTIRITGWCPVDRTFSARFSCCGGDRAKFWRAGRVYRYYFLRREYDIERMREAVRLFEGEHDFRNFCRIDAVNVCDFTRTVFRGEVLEIQKGWAKRGGLMQRDASARRFRCWNNRSCVFMASSIHPIDFHWSDSMHDESSLLSGFQKRRTLHHFWSSRHIEESLQAAVSSRRSRTSRSLRLRFQSRKTRRFADLALLPIHSIASTLCSHSREQHKQIQSGLLLLWCESLRCSARRSSQGLRGEGLSDAYSWSLRLTAAKEHSRGVYVETPRRFGGGRGFSGGGCAKIHAAWKKIESTLCWMREMRCSVVWGSYSVYGRECSQKVTESVSIHRLWEEWVYSRCNKGEIGEELKVFVIHNVFSILIGGIY